MTHTDKHIVASYAFLFEGLSTNSKLELIESLTESLKHETSDKDARFYQSFGAFASDKPAEDIIADLKASRQFRKKDIRF